MKNLTLALLILISCSNEKPAKANVPVKIKGIETTEKKVLPPPSLPAPSYDNPGGHQIDQVSALKSAKTWFNYLEKGKYSLSYKQASARFKRFKTRKDWVKSIKPLYKSKLKFKKRRLVDLKGHRKTPNLKYGDVVILTYETELEEGLKLVEEISTYLEKGGTWRVGDYNTYHRKYVILQKNQ